MDENKEYYAFISYKREDEKWAKWLQHKLEHYKFPTNLNGRSDLPKNIRPTFRDVTDLSPEPLEQAINNALQNSQWLIVVCSPRSAKSPWVCKEAQTFIDMGRSDHIIPFVIEGNPFSDDTATECYPEALLNLTGSQELLAANINEMGRDAAVIKVVARMFGLKFDSLWQRYERQKRKTRVIASVSAIAVIALAVIITLVFRQQKRTLQLSQSRFIAEKVEALIENGDSYLAQLLLLEVLPDGSVDNRPYSAEAEFALRKALDRKTYRLPCSDIGGHGLIMSPNDKYIIGYSTSDTVYVWKTCNGEIVNKFHIPNISEPFYSNFLDAQNVYSESFYFFDSDSTLCVVDSMMHLWNILTGENFKNKLITKNASPVINAFGSGKVISMEVSEKTNVWDFDSVTKQYLMRGLDGCLSIMNARKEPVKTIPIKNALVATFMPNHDDVFVVTNNHFLIWSIHQESVVRHNRYQFDSERDDEGYDGGDITMRNFEFNKSLNKVVINGYNWSGDVWILADVFNPDNYSISRKPILISTEGDMTVVNISDRTEDINYFVEFDNKNSDTCYKINYPYLYSEKELNGEKMTIEELSDLKGPNMDGEYVVQVDDDTFFIDASTFKKVEKRKDFEGKLIGFSSNKQYSVTQKNDSLFIYKNGKKIKNIDLKGLPSILNVEISSNGKYLLTNHIDEEGDLHYVWNVDNGNVIHVIRDIELKKWLFGPDGDRLCSSYGEIINLNDFSRAKLQLDNFSYGNENIYITPNGEYIVMWNGSEIAVWNALTHQQIWKKSIGYYNYPIYDVKSDNKGKLLLLTTRRDVQLFDLMSGSFYKQILDNNNLFEELESYFSPDGSSVFIITVRGVYKYDIIPFDKLIFEAKKNLSGRKLTKEERAKYHLE